MTKGLFLYVGNITNVKYLFPIKFSFFNTITHKGYFYKQRQALNENLQPFWINTIVFHLALILKAKGHNCFLSYPQGFYRLYHH
jgi:hypothetical protein